MGKKYRSWAEWNKNTGTPSTYPQNPVSLTDPYKYDPGDGYAGTVPSYQEELYTLASIEQVMEENLALFSAMIKAEKITG